MAAKGNKDIIKTLENVQNLLYELETNQYFLEEGSENQFADNALKLQDDLGDLEIPDVFSSFPIFPISNSYYAATQKDKDEKGKFFKIASCTTAILLVLYFITDLQFLNPISVIGIFISAGLGYFYNTSRKEYNKKKQVYDDSIKKYEKTNKAFLSALEVFEEQKQNCVNFAKEYSKKYNSAHDGIMNAFFNKVDNEDKIREQNEEIIKKLANNDVITPEYYHLINAIISNLKNRRAEDYAGALNIAIREEKEEQDRQERLAQEEQRNMILAMQAEEERRHNEQMERQQQAQADAMLREQKRQHDAIMREQRRKEQEANEKEAYARREAMHRCSKCKKRSACSTRAGIPNCGAFEPW